MADEMASLEKDQASPDEPQKSWWQRFRNRDSPFAGNPDLKFVIISTALAIVGGALCFMNSANTTLFGPGLFVGTVGALWPIAQQEEPSAVALLPAFIFIVVGLILPYVIAFWS